jgi:hypothetical protein
MMPICFAQSFGTPRKQHRAERYRWVWMRAYSQVAIVLTVKVKREDYREHQ